MSRRSHLIAIALLVLSLWQGLASVGVARAQVPVGGVAVVATTEGDTLALRAGPGLDYPILLGLAAGTEVFVADGPVYADGIAWYQVGGGGLTGWCAGDWLVPPAADTGTRYIGGTGGGGAWLRDDAGFAGATMLLLPEGGAVVRLGAARYADGLDWALVRYGTATGWVAAGFLGGTPAAQGGDPAADAALPPMVGSVAVGERAVITGTDGQDVRVRDGVGLSAPLFSYIPEGAVVRIVNGPLYDDGGNPWYGVDYDGLQGWVFGGYLGQTVAALSQRGGASAYDPARGDAIVREALNRLDVPYVWGGDGPKGWDCSGMIQWLYANVAGIALPRVSQDQFFFGTPLRADEVQPGDLVFFADTNGPGITHNGIAIGGGLFVHARDETRGTTISSLDDPYWAQHYAGARRP